MPMPPLNPQQTNPLPRRKNPQNNPDATAAAGSGGSVRRATEDFLRRVPPNSPDAEKAVLGGVLANNTLFHSVADLLTPEDFYVPAHRLIYEAFLELYRQGAPIDVVSVAQFLHDRGHLEQAGGGAYIAELTGSMLAIANSEYYANIVRDKSLQRSLIDTCSTIIGNCFDNAEQPVSTLLDESEQAIFSIAERTVGRSFKSSRELLSTLCDDLTQRAGRHSLVTGVSTTYTQLDQLTAGLQPSDLIILAARPSMGKTAFALNIAMRAAVRDNVPVAIFSLEMSMEQLMARMLCAWAKIDLSNFRRGYMNSEDWQKFYETVDVLGKAPIFIDDTPAISPLDLRARTRRLMTEHKIGLVVVDYLQLMRGSRRHDSREQEVSEISRSLKTLAKELNIPIIALSQLNRKLEERTDKHPQLSDLRESGAIEQDADVILFIYRDEVYNKRDDNPNKGIAEISISKQRNGSIGSFKLSFLSAYTAFEDLAPEPMPSEALPETL
ncbi:MAG: replicative DNA helicase [Desulfovibrionaceae bacterium]|nr:replicative DNA helicase [Desulfovibrionaceae bacterium]